MADVNLEEAMSLAPGFGVIPEHQRNKGYDKLDYDPGQGGFILAQEPAPAADNGTQAFLAGVAAGADPQQLAKELLHSSTPSRPKRGR